MKKHLLSLCLMDVGSAFAQSEIVVGDMNDDGQLTVATVSADGLVTAVKGGRCTIIARAADGSWEATCSLTITQLVESITLSNNRLTMGIYAEQRLVPTVLTDNAEDITLTWTSSDETVAEVSKSGLVYIVGYGRCTITATANDGSGVKAECVIVVEKPHEYVDLGLPSGTLWATTNVGANSPEEYGDYFAWGEVEPKSTYNWSTYKWMKEGYSDGKGCSKYTAKDGQTSGCWYNNGTFIGDNKTELDLEDDAAYMNWGEGWRMPSLDQIKELYNSNYTTTQWTSQNGKNGLLITSKSNGASLFLPAAGLRDEGSLYIAGSGGYFLSRSLSTSYSDCTYLLFFSAAGVDLLDYSIRFYGLSVRPVRVSASALVACCEGEC